MTASTIRLGRFTDPAQEAEFRLHSWPEWSLRLRIIALAGAAGMGAFAWTDYRILGPGLPLYALWSLRLALLVAAVAVARITLGVPRPRLLDAATLGLLLFFGATLMTVVALTGRGLLLQVPGAILMVLSFYLFVTTRFEIQVAGGLFVGLGVLLVADRFLSQAPEELYIAAGELLICNTFGAFTALRMHRLQRREQLQTRQLQRRVALEELMARLSTRFITASIEQAETHIDDALAEIGEFIGVDRAYVFEFDHVQKTSSCTHEWCRRGLPPAMRTLQRVPYSDFSWAMNELLEGRPLIAPRLDAWPPQAAAERAEAERHGARSTFSLPLLFGRRVLGAIGVHGVRSELEWSGETETILRITGAMIVGVLQHRRARDQLAEQSRSLEDSVAALEKSNAELEQFAHVASHDLQEPLRSISSFSSLLSERYHGRLDASADEYLGFLRTAANRMHELVTRLLGYSGLARAGSVFEPLDAGEVLTEALFNLKKDIAGAGAEILTDAMPTIQGDRGQLVQVFQHLLDNALKFRGPLAPRIVFEVTRMSELWEFAMRDNGIGIESRHHQRIFQPFARLHAVGRYAGTGIGLAICRRVIERHGGQIRVESDGVHGSTFRFTLPAAE